MLNGNDIFSETEYGPSDASKYYQLNIKDDLKIEKTIVRKDCE